MALIRCSECSREISDKAQNCPGCGAPVNSIKTDEPKAVRYNPSTNTFSGTMPLLVKLAMGAIQQNRWTLEQVNEKVGLVVFKTNISWGSWSGVTCSLNITECSLNTFRVSGTGKQNISGGQLIAFNIGGEAQKKHLRRLIR